MISSRHSPPALVRRSRLLRALCLLLALSISLPATAARPERLPGLRAPAKVVWDHHGIPHVWAADSLDTSFLMGYLHARDRLFQMDTLRRQFSGTLAELLGPAALPADIQFRTLGFRRAAEETWPRLSAQSRLWLEAYAGGVNAFLATRPLPPEYSILELTAGQFPPWSTLDTLTIAKGVVASFSLDLSDLGRSVTLAAYQAVGSGAGFDGAALLFEDLDRFEPFHPTITIPDPSGATAGAAASGLSSIAAGGFSPAPEALELARSYRDRLQALPALADYLNPSRGDRGSNWWLVSPHRSRSASALFAADPHRGLGSPAGPYEIHLVAPPSRGRGRLDASGFSFPGAPAIIQGCTRTVCWGGSFHPADVSDVYQESLVLDPASGLPTHTLFRGEQEALVVLPQAFRINQVGDGVDDNLVPAEVPPSSGGLTFVVPRRHQGPIVAVDTSGFPRVVGLSLQYSGSRASQEVESLRRLLWARDLDDVEDALRFFDAPQNWAAADSSGGIAYWVSGELPLREDLQELERPDGAPPFLLRDGTGTRRNEWLAATDPPADQSLPFRVLPFAELPRVRDPERGFLLNANNDPTGATLDNDPLNQTRDGGGIYYLGFSYPSLRAGRLEDLFREALAGGRKLDLEDMKRFQADHQLFDGELFVPFILEAFRAAGAPGAPPSLTALAADPRVAEAVGRLESWDFSTPTGIREGYDPGDDPAALPFPSQEEIEASVAATVFALWRSRMMANTVDGAIEAVGLGGFKTVDIAAWQGIFHLLRTFEEGQGVGASGLRLIPLAPDSAAPAHGRDLVLLRSLREALDLLAGDDFAAAFGGSEQQEDYRWGRLHRVVFAHPLGSPFSIPEGGGFSHLEADLPGLPRTGGLSTVDAAAHFIGSGNDDGFRFRSGPDSRSIFRLDRRRIEGLQVLAGGQSSLPGSPFQADQLGLWLTNRYRRVLLRPREILESSSRIRIFLPGD